MADAKITKALAREIASDVPEFARWDQVRDLCDLATGDLDCWQLDKLTDWVTAIVNERARGLSRCSSARCISGLHTKPRLKPMSDRYILDEDHNAVPCEDLFAWGKWFETADRHVACDNFGDIARVSTVFLGIDHNYSDSGRPLLFETMIFWDGHELDQWQRRCSTWAEAEQMHLRARGLVVEAGANSGRIRIH